MSKRAYIKGPALKSHLRKGLETRADTLIVEPHFSFDDLEISDGYHTMDELYEHRARLWITFCAAFSEFKNKLDPLHNPATVAWLPEVWRSRLHSDGTSFEGMFVLGMGKAAGSQITYHLDDRYWEETEFAETLDNAPGFDGHTPMDVLDRLKGLI